MSETTPTLPSKCRVYTPPVLAEAMVKVLGNGHESRWLEPSVGQGAFLTALKNAGVDGKLVTAIDLDRKGCDLDSYALTRRGIEFLAWSQRTDASFERIIGNPPYVSLSQWPESVRQVASTLPDPKGHPISLGANTWYAFLCACLSILKRGGHLALVLPAAWDYADYCAAARSVLPSQFRSFVTHRSKRPLFDAVQDGSVVIVGKGFGYAHKTHRRIEYECLDDLVCSLRNGRGGVGRAPIAPRIHRPGSGVKGHLALGELLEIRLGGVTGDAQYFLLRESRKQALRLPKDACLPVLSRAGHLRWDTVNRGDWDKLRAANERVWLFHPTDAAAQNNAVKRYLQLDPSKGGCRRDRYKIRIRKPWYRTPLPGPFDGFMSGMLSAGPWICFNRMRGLVATNTLYTVRFSKSLGADERYTWALSLLTSRFRDKLHKTARIYADVLVKLEPGQLARLPLRPPRTIPNAASTYKDAIEALLGGDHDLSQRIAAVVD